MLRRPTALLALLAAVATLVIGAAITAGTAPVGAQTSSTTTSSTSSSTTSSSSSTTSTTTAPTSTTVPQTTTTQRATTTTQRATSSTSSSTSSSSTTSTSSTSTTVAPAVVPPGYSDPSAKGSSFWTTGRKIGAVIALLVLIGLSMAVLTFFYWRATRPGSQRREPTGPVGGGNDPAAGPVGPLDAMVADALRPDPFVTRDDLGLT